MDKARIDKARFLFYIRSLPRPGMSHSISAFWGFGSISWYKELLSLLQPFLHLSPTSISEGRVKQDGSTLLLGGRCADFVCPSYRSS